MIVQESYGEVIVDLGWIYLESTVSPRFADEYVDWP